MTEGLSIPLPTCSLRIIDQRHPEQQPCMPGMAGSHQGLLLPLAVVLEAVNQLL